MKTALVYPFDNGNTVLARFNMLLSEYHIEFFVAPKGRMYEQKDTNIIDGGDPTGFYITEDFEKALSHADTAIFLSSSAHVTLDLMASYVAKAEALGKEIVLASSLANKFRAASIEFTYHRIIGESAPWLEPVASNRLEHIDIPVVSVYGIGESCNKFEVQLSLRKLFLEKNRSILQIGTKEYSELFGFQCFPSFVYDYSLSLSERILMLNRYVNHLIIEQGADVLIVGIPGGVVSLDSYFHNSFSELPYIVSCAIQPDVSILSVYHFPKMNEDFLLELREHMRHKYGALVDYFHISNCAYTIDNTDEVPELVFLKQKSSLISETMDALNATQVSVLNVLGSRGVIVLERIYEELEMNVEVI
ncbi:MAG: TIGR04066 family peptide maturation system protein [Christensenellaceae bacterium]